MSAALDKDAAGCEEEWCCRGGGVVGNGYVRGIPLGLQVHPSIKMSEAKREGKVQ